MVAPVGSYRPLLAVSSPPQIRATPPPKPTRAAPYAPPPGTVVCGVQPERTAGAVALGIVFFVPALLALLASLPFALVAGAITGPQKDGPGGRGTFLYGFTETLRWIQQNVFFLFHTPMRHAVTTIGQSFVVSPFLLRRLPNGDREFTVRVYLEGAAEDVAKPRRFAKAISEHLSIPHNTVHVEFVDRPDPYAMTIPVHRGGVSYALSWNADDDANTFAHELMHRLGLLDEYNHSAHFTNPAAPASFKFTRIFERLYQEDLPADRLDGIMAVEAKKPLPRHFDAIVRRFTP